MHNYYLLQKLCAVSGGLAIALFFIGLVIAGFFPPLSPSLDVVEVAAIYREHTTAIRMGMIVVLVSGLFEAPFIGVMIVQLKRIKDGALLAYSQACAGTIGILFFILPALMFLIASYRPERSMEITYMLNDAGWIIALIGWPPAFAQNILIGTAILCDKSDEPIFPRWLAYLNIWMAVTFIPASILIFVTSGPFAWNGIFSFWIPGSAFGIWQLVMIVMLFKSINRQRMQASAD